MKIHSISDVITNSSTELFVISSEVSCVDVEKRLDELWRNFCAEYKEYERTSLEANVKIADKSYYTESAYGPGWSTYLEYHVGDIMIRSSYDNSIPYDFFEWIENEFNCKRYHMG